ncbi:MAG: 50S ribosomal protein L10 [Candidatus Azambacteria bacterium GW2011_GWA2_42_9]|uniref:Large ribosomal subunit protein uL10 n=1 Tax=Candidatus Azambacteria bacterium GW2011_GWA2_42_9 TaxID=1618613 RepID=A0A0G1BS72_9BACT|nr:MAG: 50S ribosomal protein L10 [Candidatus Azambacteria bacterium GW2011_GWA2_42_9]
MIKKEQKNQIIKSLEELLKSSKSIVFFDYQKIPTQTLNLFRDKLFDKGAKFSIYKNTLLEKALNKLVPGPLEGPTAVLFSQNDPVEPIKELYNFKKENESIYIKFGILEGKLLAQNDVDVLATLPSKQELLGQVVEGFSSPIRGLVTVLSGVQRSFVYVLSQISSVRR